MLRKNVLRYQPVAGRDLGDGEVAVNAAGDADGAEEFEVGGRVAAGAGRGEGRGVGKGARPLTDRRAAGPGPAV